MQFELTTNRSALGWDMYVFDCIEWHQLYQKCFKLLLLLLYSYHSLSNSNYCHRQFRCCLFFSSSILFRRLRASMPHTNAIPFTIHSSYIQNRLYCWQMCVYDFSNNTMMTSTKRLLLSNNNNIDCFTQSHQRERERERVKETEREREPKRTYGAACLYYPSLPRMNLWPVFCLLPHNILYCNGMGVLFAQITIKTFSGKNKQREEETAKLNRKKTYHF